MQQLDSTRGGTDNSLTGRGGFNPRFALLTFAFFTFVLGGFAFGLEPFAGVEFFRQPFSHDSTQTLKCVVGALLGNENYLLADGSVIDRIFDPVGS